MNSLQDKNLIINHLYSTFEFVKIIANLENLYHDADLVFVREIQSIIKNNEEDLINNDIRYIEKGYINHPAKLERAFRDSGLSDQQLSIKTRLFREKTRPTTEDTNHTIDPEKIKQANEIGITITESFKCALEKVFKGIHLEQLLELWKILNSLIKSTRQK